MKRKLQIADLTHRIYLMEQAYSKLDQEHDKLKAENSQIRDNLLDEIEKEIKERVKEWEKCGFKPCPNSKDGWCMGVDTIEDILQELRSTAGKDDV